MSCLIRSRKEVESFPTDYGRISGANEWADLPIDLDSLTEVWSAMWPSTFLEKIHSIGPPLATHALCQSRSITGISALIETCNLGGISTLGEEQVTEQETSYDGVTSDDG